MASYYRRFIAGFTKFAQPLHRLTAKDVEFLWSPEREAAFRLQKKLVTPPILVYSRFGEEFTLETDASILGLRAVLSQKQPHHRLHPVAYASRALYTAEKNYGVTKLETLAVVWGITHFHSYLYGGDVTIITDHSAMKPVLEAPNPTGKRARWWMRVYGRGIKSIAIMYRAGKENAAADAFSRSPIFPAPEQGIGQGEMQVSVVTSADPESSTALQGPILSSLLHSMPAEENVTVDYAVEQMKDPGLWELALYMQREELPRDSERARRLVARAPQFVLNHGILNYLDQGHRDSLRVAVSIHLREKLMHESHRGVFSGHFAGPKLYKALSQRYTVKRVVL